MALTLGITISVFLSVGSSGLCHPLVTTKNTLRESYSQSSAGFCNHWWKEAPGLCDLHGRTELLFASFTFAGPAAKGLIFFLKVWIFLVWYTKIPFPNILEDLGAEAWRGRSLGRWGTSTGYNAIKSPSKAVRFPRGTDLCGWKFSGNSRRSPGSLLTQQTFFPQQLSLSLDFFFLF